MTFVRYISVTAVLCPEIKVIMAIEIENFARRSRTGDFHLEISVLVEASAASRRKNGAFGRFYFDFL